MMKFKFIYSISFASLFLLMACDPGPQDIRVGQQECDHCRMMISDERFASQLITQQGRQYAFDAIECMAAFIDGKDASRLDIHSLWAPDFFNPGTWIAAEEAVYVQSDQLRSPMAVNISSYTSREYARRQQSEFGGEILNWEEARQQVRQAWSAGHRH
jgi:copper chaperone NosL